MLTYLQAQEILATKAFSFGEEDVDLLDALDKILAEDIFAPRDFPPFNRSAMDGFAFRLEDLEAGITDFQLIETIFAGKKHSLELKKGECYKIMTGAATPLCADVVIRREDIQEQNEHISFSNITFKKYQNIAIKGQDLKEGDLALKKGSKINVASIGILASFGKSKVNVQKLPRVNILTTGDEVIDLTEKVNDLQIHNSNTHVLQALLKKNNIIPKKVKHEIDDEIKLSNVIEKLLSDTDILLITGGVSAGDADYIPAILENLGIQKLFHKLAIKPGKPIFCGYHPNKNIMIFALPGNPFSCMVTFKLFVDFFIKSSTGEQISTIKQEKIDFSREQKSKFDEFFPVLSTNNCLTKISINGSGDIRLGNIANALAIHPSNKNILNQDEEVFYLDF